MVWDDSSWSTGSLSPLVTGDLERLKIYFKNLREEYKEGPKVKFRVVGRELYPTTKTLKLHQRNLQSIICWGKSVFYEVKDGDTEETIIPFGTGSKVSCDKQEISLTCG